MREFNTFGPVNPREHYHVNRAQVKADLCARIDKGRYLTLSAARQTGKTTLLREVHTELEATGAYFVLMLDFSALKGFSSTRLYARLSADLQIQATRLGLPAPGVLGDHGDFIDWLRLCIAHRAQRGVLIIDEFDATPEDVLANLLSLLRAMYLARFDAAYPALHSVILVGVRDIPSLLHGTQSPFNIADSFTIPYFTPAEVADLFGQHTEETGQQLAPEVVSAIAHETQGQPFLVNRLGQLLTTKIVPVHSQPIGRSDLDYAMSLLLSENNTHFASILSKATPQRDVLLPMLLYDGQRTDFLAPVTQELLMYGVLRIVEDEQHLRFARIACPIYRKLLLSYLSAALSSVGGLVTIESVSAAGEVDLLVFHKARRFIIETKIWRGPSTYTDGVKQLVAYITAAGLEKGYLVVFDERLAANPLLAADGAVFEKVVADKRVRTYLAPAL